MSMDSWLPRPTGRESNGGRGVHLRSSILILLDTYHKNPDTFYPDDQYLPIYGLSFNGNRTAVDNTWRRATYRDAETLICLNDFPEFPIPWVSVR